MTLKSRCPGPDPTIVSYNTTGSLVRFEKKNILF
jgi:hypothetical protein